MQRLQPCGSVGISTKSNFNIYEGLRLCFHFPSVFFPLIDVSWHVFVSGALFSGFCLLLLSLVLDINVEEVPSQATGRLVVLSLTKVPGGVHKRPPCGMQRFITLPGVIRSVFPGRLETETLEWGMLTFLVDLMA